MKIKNILDIYFTKCRFDNLSNTLEENKEYYKNKIKNVVEYEDYNLQLIRVNKRRYFEKLIQGQKILTSINPQKIQTQKRSDYNNNIDKYFNSLSNDQYNEVKTLYNLDHNDNNNITAQSDI